MKRRICLCMGMAVCMCLTSCGILPTEEEFDTAPIVKEYEGTSFSKVAVSRGDLIQTEDVIGNYKGTVKEEITPEESSIIKKIYVKEGMKVEAGDPILQYYLPASEKALRKAKNDIEKTTLQIRHARRLMEMEVQKLKRLGGSSQEIENMRNQYNQQIKSHQSSLKLLRMDEKIAKEEIQEEEVTASVDGVVTYVDEALEGAIGDSKKPVVKIEGKKKNRFEANSKYADRCQEGDVVTIEVNTQEYKATIGKDANSKNKVYFYPTSKLNLEDGVACTYKVVLREKKDVLYLPSAIVYTMGDRHVVYYEDENGLKSTKEVTIGDKISSFVEIKEGLSENEQVVAN